MILKRMTASLKRQDWAMVFIEFVLVVVGVLLGFQINNWGNERAGARSREEATARLLEEAENDVAYLKSAIAYESAIADGLKLQLRAVADPGLRPAAAADDQLFNRARGIVPLAPPTSAFDDVVSAGNLTSIGNSAVRDTISRFHATLLFEERMREQLQSSAHAIEGIDAIRIAIDPAGKFHWAVDYGALAREPMSLRLLAHAAQNHQLATNFRRRALSDAQTMCRSLATAVGRPCNLAVPIPTYK